MAITVTPTLPVIAASPAAATPGLVLQPGAVVSAQVLNTLAENLVQIAIAGLTIDVLSEVPLQAGQHLQLAISQTESGIRLAIVPPPSQGASGAEAEGGLEEVVVPAVSDFFLCASSFMTCLIIAILTANRGNPSRLLFISLLLLLLLLLLLVLLVVAF